MKIWTDISQFNAKNACITIGSFDGVHLGHLEVLKQLNEIAQRLGGESVVFTFDPHPVKVLHPGKKLEHLTTISEKITRLEIAGIDHLILYPFSKEFSKLSYVEFVTQILVKQLDIYALLTGYDNTIGKNREGNYQQLQQLSIQLGFNIFQQQELTIDEESISSTKLRHLLSCGELENASKLLGYPYMFTGKVIKGKQLGNKLGFPTANIIPPPDKVIPAIGVYAVQVTIDGGLYGGMMNLGLRPTIDDELKNPMMEVNVFDFDGDLYGKTIVVSIVQKIRQEIKFANLDALRQQLQLDKKLCLAIVNKNK